MPLHPEFSKILKEMKRLHGEDKGETLFYVWVNKKGYNEERALSVQDSIQERKFQADNEFKQILNRYKQIFADVIKKRVDETYDTAIEEAAKELSVSPIQLIDFEKVNAAKLILKENFVTINSELFDAIDKELSILTTDISLKGVPISNAKLKQEIQSLLKTKLPRLESQAVTETTRVANTALEYGYKDSGLVVQKQWVAVLDERTTGICRGLNGEIKDIGTPFSTGDFRPPAHINCRSSLASITISRNNI